MQIDDFIDVASKAIFANNASLSSISQKILPLKGVISPNGLENIVVSVKKQSLSCVVSGVDSGFVSKKLSFIDLAFVRVAGVVFSLDGGFLKKADYFPSAFSFPEPIMLRQGLESDEELQSVSFERLKKEVSLSIDIIKKSKPKYAFVDGSIVPQYKDKPRDNSELSSDYQGIIHLFQKFYKTAEENNCTIISCVEDSRGKRFVELLREKILPKNPVALGNDLAGFFDASLLDYFLLPGERTFAFSYTEKIDNHAILKDYPKEWSESISVFYLKASQFDKPLRVEFICKNKSELSSKADEIASIVFSLSSLHREYSYPSILIEADLRARLNEEDINVVFDKLLDKLGPKAQMRRNNRPFG